MKNLIKSFLILAPTLVSAQDVLYKTDNSKQEVKVSEVNETTIKYKLYNNLDGPFYVINKNDVAMVVYQNGQHEVFKTQPIVSISNAGPVFVDRDSLLRANKTKRFLEVTKNKNIAFVNLLGIGNSCFSASYMREAADGLLLIHTPFSFSFSQPFYRNLWGALDNGYGVSNYLVNKKDFDFGLGGYICTSGKRAVTHFIGPLYRYARFEGAYDVYKYDYVNYTGTTKETYKFIVDEQYFMVNTGFLYRLTPNFNMMINAAFGSTISRQFQKNDPASHSQNGYNRNTSTPVFQFGFNLGYRF
jgi:hypothetical protein